MMINKNKERILRDICQNHSARSDRDVFRVSPNKLSKQELEDIYYTLVDNNFRLKDKIKTLEDKVKSTSNKLQRMTTAQRTTILKEKGISSGTKTLIYEQKEQIEDLQLANRKLVEKIKLLNMQLCSAKQFFNGSGQGSRCPKCFIRNSTNMLNAKRSETNLKASTSCQYIDKEVMTSRSMLSSVSVNTEEHGKQMQLNISCDENKCATQIEELKNKVCDLETELTKALEKYKEDVSKLDQQCIALRQENIHLRNQNTMQEERFQDLASKLRAVEIEHHELSSQLLLERKKVIELEMQLKIKSISSINIAKAIDDHINKVKVEEFSKSVAEVKKKAELSISKHELKYSDDSGYTDSHRTADIDQQFIVKQNQELIKQVDDLKSQISLLQATKDTSEQKIEMQSLKDTKPMSIIDKNKAVIPPKEESELEVIVPSISKSTNRRLTSQDLSEITKKDTIKHSSSDELQFSSFFVNIENTSSPLVMTNKKNDQENKRTSKFGDKVSDNKLDQNTGQDSTENYEKKESTNSNHSDSDRKDRTRTLSKSKSLHDRPIPKPRKSVEKPTIQINNNNTEDLIQNDVEPIQHDSLHSEGTYVVKDSKKNAVVSRPESPENTDCEISSLSDLPEEKYVDRREPSTLSPGEDRVRVLSSDTARTTTTEYNSLSEGELPGFRTGRQLSIGEKQMTGTCKRDFDRAVDMSSPQKVQLAISAVSAELSRCRRLLRMTNTTL